MIGILADANKIIATGHIMRCLTITRQINKLREDVVFFVSDNESEEVVRLYGGDIPVLQAPSKGEGNGSENGTNKSGGMQIVNLSGAYNNLESEADKLRSEIKSRGIELLLADSYFVTVPFFERLRGLCTLAYIDDLGKEAYPVDILINYSGYYKEMDYESLYEGVKGHSEKPTKLLLGLSYAPLREQFWRNDQGSHSETSILLTSGGADKCGMLLKILKEAEKTGLTADAIPWHVVLGNLVSDEAELNSFAESHRNVFLHRNVTDMAGLMRECDIAAAAAGTMLTECATIALPTVFYQTADNQRFNVSFWQTTGGMIFAGDAEADRHIGPDKNVDPGLTGITVAETVCRLVKDLIGDKNRLGAMKEKLKDVTDGRGAERIAAELCDQDIL